MNCCKQSKFIISTGFAVVCLVLAGATPTGLFSATASSSHTSKRMTLAALGDCIISRKVSVRQDPGFLNLVKLIRSADCTWANCELPIVDIDKAYPAYREMDLPGACEPWVADELKWLGVDFVGFANNHTMDYGYEGLFSTIENLKRVGIGYAGAGKDLEDAGRPRYVDTAGGRVGQVNCASSYHHGTFASFPNPYVNGRPGLNPLRITETIQLKKESFETLKKIYKEVEKFIYEEEFGYSEGEYNEKKNEKDKDKGKKPGNELKISNIKFVPGEKIGYLGTVNEKDLNRITDMVKVARRNARIVIVGIHEHWGTNKYNAPVKHIETFARACIDSGADVVFNTGPHRLWGIEIYKGKPIFYSLGNFFFQITTDCFPAEIYTNYGFKKDTRDASQLKEIVNKKYFNKTVFWESIVPIITFENGNEVIGIKLYPIALGKDVPIYQQGTPVLAGKEEGKKIIQGLIKLSEPYKTKIEFREREGIGVIQLK
jgi:poly-gamma-glutamate capsule biosynthesis protein CapA/YwtB (metallophosphatase superfamily)